MGKRGEAVRPLAARLALNRAQQMKLQAAAMPTDQEVGFLLDYEARLPVVRSSDERLAREHIVGLGTPAREAVFRRISDIVDHPEQYDDNWVGCATLFRCAGAARDMRVLPLLEHIEQQRHGRLRYYARQSREALESNNSFAPLP